MKRKHRLTGTALAIMLMCSGGMILNDTQPLLYPSLVTQAYSTGEYKVNTSSGVNVRSGAGSGYSKVGASKNGTSFTVDQISGDWGHTNAISCTNGTKSGWVCLSYCKETGGGSSTSGFTSATYQVKVSSTLRVRTEPNTKSNVKTSLKNGTLVYITSKTGNWGYASNYGGYVSLDYCTFVSDSDLTNGGGSTNSGNYTTSAISSGSTYRITPACATGSSIDVSGLGTENGTNIHLWESTDGNNQKFKAILVSNGYYTFYDTNSGKVIDVSGGIVADGTNIQLHQYNGTSAQLWRIIDAGGGYYYLQSKLNSSYYMDVNGANSGNGTNIQLYKGNGSNAQKFRFSSVSTGSSGTKISLDVPLYKQNDSRWGGTYIGNKTIGKVGCIITSLAMAYSYNTHSTVYPNTMKNRLKFSNNSIYWSSVTGSGFSYYNYGGAGINQSIMSTIYSKLKAGRPVVIWCQNSSGNAHAVTVTGYTGNNTSNFSASDFRINDPAYSRTNLQQHLNYVNKVYYIMY